MENKNKYQPISCSFYDLLVLFATKKQEVTLTYLENNQQKSIQQAIIADIYTKKSEEFIVLKSGETIRLDYIQSVNDQQQKDGSCKI